MRSNRYRAIVKLAKKLGASFEDESKGYTVWYQTQFGSVEYDCKNLDEVEEALAEIKQNQESP